LTCSLALVTLPSIISDTRSATPCPNCAVSTPAATLKVGVGTLSLEVFEVSSCEAPTLPSFDAPESGESGLLPCERLSAALALAAGETTCATEAAAAAVTAADIAAADACAKAAAAASAVAALNIAAPGGPSILLVAESLAEAASGAGALVPCATAAAMAACAAASVPAAAGPLLEVEAFSVVESLSVAAPEDGVEFTDASVPWFAVAPLDLAALPAGTAGTVTVVGVPGAAGVRMLTACGMLGPPEAAVVGALADDGIGASTAGATGGGAARIGGAASAGVATGAAAAARAAAAGEGVKASAGVATGGAAMPIFRGAAVSIFSVVEMVVAPLALGGVVDAAPRPLGTGPCTLPGEPLAAAWTSATTAAEPVAGGGELGPGGG
jgi:hypothetical protein